MPESPNVSLRARTDADLDVLYALVAELDTWEERGPAGPYPLTRAQWDARQGRGADDQFPEDTAAFVIDVDGDAVGGATMFGFDHLARSAEVGITLLPAARGHGIGTAAMIQLVTFGFERRNLHRIHLEAIASNTAAIRSYEKAGFVLEGRQREHAWVRGHDEDLVRMGILRSEWRS